MKYFLRTLIILVLPVFILSTGPAPKLNVYVFLLADCPCIYSHKDSFGKLLKQYSGKINFKLVFEGEDDNEAKMSDLIKQLDWKVACIKDEGHKLQKRFKPSLSTDCVVFNEYGQVIYKGAIDDGAKNMGMIKNFYLLEVVTACLLKKPLAYSSMPGTGCNLK